MYVHAGRRVRDVARHPSRWPISAPRPVYSPSDLSDAWLTPESRARLRALAECDASAAEEDEDAELHDASYELAQRLCADVRARGGSAVDLVIALKEAWAGIPREDPAQRRRASVRLSRIVTLSIHEFYLAQRREQGGIVEEQVVAGRKSGAGT